MQEQITLCACGCGQALSARAGIGAKFVRGHYWRVVKTRRPRRLTPLADRFWPKVICDLATGCWLWTGAINSRGYGSISIGKRGVTDEAHRVSWLIHYGVLPTEWVLHKCDVRDCVRIDHLFLGDVQANADDMNAKGRGVLPKRQPTYEERARGERQGSAKLTADIVAEICWRYANESWSQTELAHMYGLGQSHISRLIRHKSWSHLT